MVQEASLAEAGEFAGVEDLLTRMVRQRAIEPPEAQPEEPVLLLILAEGGLTLFSFPFEIGRQLNGHLIGGFLAAINTFGKEVLAEPGTIDRIMYDEYTVAIKVLDAMMFCYVFKGHSYLALQKLEQFMSHIRTDAARWKILTMARQEGRIIIPKTLQDLVAEVFQS